MNHTPIIKIFVLLFVLTAWACEGDFDEINQDPNVVTDVPAEYFLPGSIEAMADLMNSNYEELSCAANWTQQVAFYNTWMAPQYYDLDRFRIAFFTSLYTGPLMDLSRLREGAKSEGNDALYAAGLTLTALGYQTLTDIFGDVPYLQSTQLTEGYSNPVYDTQESIYTALLDSLTLANELLKNADDFPVSDGYDPLYEGSIDGWRKFANSLRIRLLMRMSGQQDVSAALTTMVNDPDTYPLFSSTAESAFYTYSGNGLGNDYPLASLFEAGSADPGVYISDKLVQQLEGTNDPRLEYYALPAAASGDYVGCSHQVSYSANLGEGYFSRIHSDLGAADRSIEFYEYAELMFLLAEAAQRGFITADAEAYYNAGIAGSCTKFGVATVDATAFIENDVAYNGTLQQICVQKWVALFMQGYEAWAEYRRTGFPELDLAANNLLDQIPSRFLYPNVELGTNLTNLNDAAARMEDGDAMTSPVWWMP